MLIVALTGGIASGKSVVARFLAARGCAVHSADATAHEVMAPGRPAWERIVSHFGPSILNPDRTINRRRLGDIVFGDEAERSFLNSVVHPLVLERKRELITELESRGGTKIFVSEAALVLEAGFSSFYDKIVVVFCRPDIQRQRLISRDGLTPEEAARRISSQMPVEEKKTMADYLIDTSGSLEETERRTEAVYRRLVRDADLKERRLKPPRI